MTRTTPRRQIVIMVTRDEWQQLSEQGRQAERDPYQQARWLLVQQLRGARPAPADEEGEPVEVAS